MTLVSYALPLPFIVPVGIQMILLGVEMWGEPILSALSLWCFIYAGVLFVWAALIVGFFAPNIIADIRERLSLASVDEQAREEEAEATSGT